jgi:hypothetical protein
MASQDQNREGTAVPEADRLEQEQPADPRVDETAGWPVAASEEADEGDRLEQAQEVLDDPDEEEYEAHPT